MIHFKCPKCDSELVVNESEAHLVVTRKDAKGRPIEWTFAIPHHTLPVVRSDYRTINMWRHRDDSITYAHGSISKVCRLVGAEVSVDKLPP